MGSGVIVSWVRHHGRSEGIAAALGYANVFAYSDSKFLPIRYIKQARQTWTAVRNPTYRQVIVMLPPLPALLTVIAASPGKQIVADLHTGFFLDPKWRWATSLTLRILRRRSAIVTNQKLADWCERKGVQATVLHDILVEGQGERAQSSIRTDSRNAQIVCPLSYANDEPLEELVDSFQRLPEIEFVLTGNAPKWIQEQCSDNVKFTGYVSNEEYWRLISECSGVLALTNRDLTMQRAGYEALLCGTPHVTSNFDVLRQFYVDAAVYTDLDSNSIVSAIKQLIADSDILRSAGESILAQRRSEQKAVLHFLRKNVPAVKNSDASSDGSSA